MADITMCRNDKCEQRESCYRYTAVVNKYWQPVFVDSQTSDGSNCKYFWDNTGRIDGRKVGIWWRDAHEARK